MKLSLFEKIFTESKKYKRIISIRKYHEEDDFWCGYVVDFNETLVTIQHFTRFGKPDGLVVEQLDNIESIDSGDNYSKAYQYLIKNSAKLDKQVLSSVPLTPSENWRHEFIAALQGTKVLVSFEFENTQLYGFIDAFDGEYISMHCIGKIGEDEGKSIYRIAEIISMYADTMESRKRKLLYDWRSK